MNKSDLPDLCDVEDHRLLEELSSRLAASHQARIMAEDSWKQMQHMADRVFLAEHTKTRFLSNARNEINNPATALLGLSRKLISEASPAPAHVGNIARLLQEEAFKLHRHLENIFTAADLESGNTKPCWSKALPGCLIRGIIQEFSYQIEDKALGLKLTFSEEEDEMVTDVGKFRLIFSNILANAICFTPPGGMVSIHFETCLNENFLELKVSDQGIGISPEFIHHAFDRFVQQSNGPCKQYPGLGLGLSNVRSLVEMLSGEVSAQSSEGHGSTFTIRLPLKPVTEDEITGTSVEGNEIMF